MAGFRKKSGARNSHARLADPHRRVSQWSVHASQRTSAIASLSGLQDAPAVLAKSLRKPVLSASYEHARIYYPFWINNEFRGLIVSALDLRAAIASAVGLDRRNLSFELFPRDSSDHELMRVLQINQAEIPLAWSRGPGFF